MTLANHSEVRAALFDIDGTLTDGGPVWPPLLKSPDVARWRKAWLYGTALPHHLLTRAGLVNQVAFRDRWVRLMAWLMSGWAEVQVQTLYDHIARDTIGPMLRPDVVDILKQHKADGHLVVLVSTMFEGIVAAAARLIGADAGVGSRVAMQNGRCMGRITGDTCAGGRKVVFAGQYLQQHGGPELSACAAYADSRSDIPFLAGVGFPVATYPDETMYQVAKERGWGIYTG